MHNAMIYKSSIINTQTGQWYIKWHKSQARASHRKVVGKNQKMVAINSKKNSNYIHDRHTVLTSHNIPFTTLDILTKQVFTCVLSYIEFSTST